MHYLTYEELQDEIDKKNIKIIELQMEITRLKALLKKEIMKPA